MLHIIDNNVVCNKIRTYHSNSIDRRNVLPLITVLQNLPQLAKANSLGQSTRISSSSFVVLFTFFYHLTRQCT